MKRLITLLKNPDLTEELQNFAIFDSDDEEELVAIELPKNASTAKGQYVSPRGILLCFFISQDGSSFSSCPPHPPHPKVAFPTLEPVFKPKSTASPQAAQASQTSHALTKSAPAQHPKKEEAEDFVEYTVIVPPSAIALVIGAKGVTINQIARDSGAKLDREKRWTLLFCPLPPPISLFLTY